MPAVLSYPGVYIEEIPSGVRTITGVATSRTAFVGRAQKGPVNEPVIINSFSDFERVFGGLWYESTLSYAVRDFFLNGGSQAVIVRLYSPLFPTDEARSEANKHAEAAAKSAAAFVAGKANEAANANPNATGEDVAAMAEMKKDAAIDAAIKSALSNLPTGSSFEIENAIKYAVNAAASTVVKAARDAVSSPDSVASAAESAANAVTGGVPALKAAKAVASAARGAVSPDATAEKVRDQAGSALEIWKKAYNEAVAADKAAKAVAAAARESANEESSTPAKVLDKAKSAKDAYNGKPKYEMDAAAEVYEAIVAANPVDADALARAAEDLVKSKYLKEAEDAQSTSQAAAEVFNAANEATHDASYVANEAEIASLSAHDNAAKEAVPIPKAQIIVDNLTFEAANEGSWSNGIQISVDYKDDEEIAKRLGVAKNTVFNMVVRNSKTEATEKYIGLTTESNNSRSLDKVLISESSLVRLLRPELPQLRPKDNISNKHYSVLPVDKASDGRDLDENDFLKSEGKMGLKALDRIDLFNMLCLPPLTREKDMPPEVYQEAEKYCIDRRAILIVDSPRDWTSADSITRDNSLADLGLSGDYARNAALYFPRVLMADPLRDRQIDAFAPCGIVAGIIARTDARRGVWKAPAGLEASLNGIVGLKDDLTDEENGMLNPLGINCLRNFKVNGKVIWGARTLQGADQLASEWKYLPVRRLALYIEESLYRGTQWIVFEPNDEPLWSQIRLNIGAFMHNLFRQGAFQGRSPREAYFVKCDKETTTQTDINNGVVNIIVGFAPLKPAEFVVIKLQQMAGQIEV